MTQSAGNPWQRGRSRPGFTLIEMLVSSVLAAILMLALVGLLRSVNQQKRLVSGLAGAETAARRLAEQVRRDFINARQIQVLAGQVRLVGPVAQDWGTRVATLRPAEVTYQVVSSGRQTWLTRKEVHLDEMSTNRTRVDLVWSGATALQVVTFDLGDAAGKDTVDAKPSPRLRPGMSLMPSHLVVTIKGADGRPVIAEEIFHHWDQS